VHRDGFTDRYYLVELSDFDDPKELPVELFPQGVVTGKVMDGFGQPLQQAHLEALRSKFKAGDFEVLGSVESNDLGEYRLSSLDPGKYRIRAMYRDGGVSEFDATPRTMASSVYGGAAKPTELVVKAGSVTAGIDFVLNPVKGKKIRGTLHTNAGAPVDRASLWIAGKMGEGGHNGSAEGGKFEFGDVSPGLYTISAQTLPDDRDMLAQMEALRGLIDAQASDARVLDSRATEEKGSKTPPLFGIAMVEVRGEDIDGVDVVMSPVPKIEGQVKVEGGSVSSVKLGMVFFHRTDGISAMGMGLEHPRADGTFEVFLAPGEYTFGMDPSPSKLIVKQITFNGKLISNAKLMIDSSMEQNKLVFVLDREAKQ
jgi:hypothetical protein